MENEHWSCALANDEVTLPMAALGSGVDLLGPFVDGEAILDGISRRSRPARAAALRSRQPNGKQAIATILQPIVVVNRASSH
jgi:hypothetical protein